MEQRLSVNAGYPERVSRRCGEVFGRAAAVVGVNIMPQVTNCKPLMITATGVVTCGANKALLSIVSSICRARNCAK